MNTWAKYKQSILDTIRPNWSLVYGELEQQTESTRGYVLGCCPLHDDSSPSFAYNIESGRFKCMSSCGGGSAIDFYAITHGLSFKDALCELGRKVGKVPPGEEREVEKIEVPVPRAPDVPHASQASAPEPVKKEKKKPTPGKCSLAGYSKYTGIPEDKLKQFGVSEGKWFGGKKIDIPYKDEDGNIVATRFRIGLAKSDGDRFRWKKKSKIGVYGLWALKIFKSKKFILLVEGESDCHTLWHCGIPALGIPGVETWKDEYAKYLEGFDQIYVVIEPDDGGRVFRRHVDESDFKDRTRALDFGGYKDPAGLFASLDGDTGMFKAQLKVILDAAPAWADYMQSYSDTRPEVVIPGDDFDNEKFIQALVERLPEDVPLFRSNSELKYLAGEPGHKKLNSLKPQRFRTLISEYVRLVMLTRKGKTLGAPCTTELAHLIMGRLEDHSAIREISMLTNYPAWTRDRQNRIIQPMPGYSSVNKYYFDAGPEFDNFHMMGLDPDNGIDRAEVHGLISPEDEGPFQRFRWANKASAVNALAAVITLIMRPAIAGAAPMVVVSAPRVSAGKSMLVKMITSLVLGKPAALRTWPRRHDELRKTVTSILRRANTIICWDNLPAGQTIDSDVLAQLITADVYEDRILGKTEDARFANRTVAFATGNNPTFSKEISQRILPIELLEHPKDERPFQEPEEVIAEHRIRVLETVHGMIAAWIKVGAPGGEITGFEKFGGWYKMLAGIMALWKFTDFAENTTAWREESDIESDDIITFLQAWAEMEPRGYTAGELVEIASEINVFPEIFDMKPRGRSVALRGRVIVPLIKSPLFVDGIGKFWVECVDRAKTSSKLYKLHLDEESA